jgi:hypothetical protein
MSSEVHPLERVAVGLNCLFAAACLTIAQFLLTIVFLIAVAILSAQGPRHATTLSDLSELADWTSLLLVFLNASVRTVGRYCCFLWAPATYRSKKIILIALILDIAALVLIVTGWLVSWKSAADQHLAGHLPQIGDLAFRLNLVVSVLVNLLDVGAVVVFLFFMRWLCLHIDYPQLASRVRTLFQLMIVVGITAIFTPVALLLLGGTAATYKAALPVVALVIAVVYLLAMILYARLLVFLRHGILQRVRPGYDNPYAPAFSVEREMQQQKATVSAKAAESPVADDGKSNKDAALGGLTGLQTKPPKLCPHCGDRLSKLELEDQRCANCKKRLPADH